MVRVELSEDQITVLRMLLLEEKLAAQGHLPLREKGTLLDEVEDVLSQINVDVAKMAARRNGKW